MIFSTKEANEQVKKLLLSYPELYIYENNNNRIQLKGSILVYRSVDDYTLRKHYQIEIIIPINSEELPSVKDAGRAISRSYRHIYNNGVLCLETEISIFKRFIDGFNLIAWMDEFVEPYFVTYEYYCEYGRFPYGEREHGSEGVLQSYQDIFGTEDFTKTYYVARFIRDHNYRGHLSCPCGSGKRIRNCHGTIMRLFYDHELLLNQVAKDMDRLDSELKAYYARRNT